MQMIEFSDTLPTFFVSWRNERVLENKNLIKRFVVCSRPRYVYFDRTIYHNGFKKYITVIKRKKINYIFCRDFHNDLFKRVAAAFSVRLLARIQTHFYTRFKRIMLWVTSAATGVFSFYLRSFYSF